MGPVWIGHQTNTKQNKTPAGNTSDVSSTNNSPGKQSPRVGEQPWRPQPRAQRVGHTRKMFLAVGVGLLAAFGVLYLFSNIERGGGGDRPRGSGRLFDMGRAEQWRKTIQKNGPIFFNDLVKEDDRSLPIAINLVGEKDWVILNALPPGSDPKCVVAWDRGQVFIDPCTKDAYSPTGKGLDGKQLERFASNVDKKGRLIANFNQPYGP